MPVRMRMTLVTIVMSQWIWIASTTASCSLFCTPISIVAFLTTVFMSQQLLCWSYLSFQVPTWLRVVLGHKMIQPDSTVAAPRTITLAFYYVHYAPINAKPHSPPPGEGWGFVTEGLQKTHPWGRNFWIIPYYSPGVYPGKAANNVKLPL